MVLHVHRWGKPAAPALICLHGVTGHGRRFERLAAEGWGGHFHVIAPDLRGHGDSGYEPPWTFPTHVADLIETLDALEIDTADWVGHSFGGRLILELAARHPERVRRAVLLDPAIQILPHVALAASDAERPDAIYESLDDYADRRPDSPREFVLADGRVHCDTLADGRLRRRTCQAAAVSIFAELASEPPPPDTLQAPTLLIHAPAYGLVREGQIAAYAERTDALAVPGMHMVIWDAFDEVLAAVPQFLLQDARAER
jgi:lipase